MAQKPSISKGTRDFSPTEVARREYITGIIKKSFENFGFQPIETPSFENSDTLMGKYGEEGDRLIFKILDSGDFYEKKVEGEKIERSLLIYIATTYIFRETVMDFLKEIDKEFILPEKFYSEENLKVIRDIYDEKSNLFLSIYIDNNELKEKAKEVFRNERKDISIKLLQFIDSRALDVEPRRNNTDLVESHLKIADRGFVREISKDLILKISQNLPEIEEFSSLQLATKISEKALRYDLTVPFARYVVQHQNELEFPFKRYQTQLVWRADRPQKGRFREFYQCDADVVGSTSLWQEVEFVQLYDDVFTKLGLKNTTIKINNRKILSGIAEIIGAKDKLIDFTVALDKLDKIGKDGVTKEMLSKGITEDAIKKVEPLFNFSGTNEEKLKQLKGMLQNSDEGTQGVNDLKFVIDAINKLGLQTSQLKLDVTLARGLNYYTGAIFEVEAAEVKMGSIGGGGRYDDLTGVFGLKNMGGIGISFGLDRIYLVLEELGLFKAVILAKPTILFLNFGENEALYCMEALKKLRALDIKSEIYPDNTKLKKQMNYANKRGIPFVVFVGLSELENDNFTLKNMSSGEQKECNFAELLQTVKNL